MVVENDQSALDSVASSNRYGFGENWRGFLSVLDDRRIAEAEKSLLNMLGMESLASRTFLDVGSGSGLFSPAAMRLGGECVHSFDFDPQSAACAAELKHRCFPNDDRWTVEQGEILDETYRDSLNPADFVHSWAELHHTGNMWQALTNVSGLVRSGGLLLISIYSDQGGTSRRWAAIKRLCSTGTLGRRLVSGVCIPYFVLQDLLSHIHRRMNPIRSYQEYNRSRGMSRIHDRPNWSRGLQFEVPKPEDVFMLYRNQGFSLKRLMTCGSGLGCNEFVLRRP